MHILIIGLHIFVMKLVGGSVFVHRDIIIHRVFSDHVLILNSDLCV